MGSGYLTKMWRHTYLLSATTEVVTQCPRASYVPQSSVPGFATQMYGQQTFLSPVYSAVIAIVLLPYSYQLNSEVVVTSQQKSSKCLQVVLLKQVFPIQNWGSYIQREMASWLVYGCWGTMFMVL